MSASESEAHLDFTERVIMSSPTLSSRRGLPCMLFFPSNFGCAVHCTSLLQMEFSPIYQAIGVLTEPLCRAVSFRCLQWEHSSSSFINFRSLEIPAIFVANQRLLLAFLVLILHCQAFLFICEYEF